MKKIIAFLAFTLAFASCSSEQREGRGTEDERRIDLSGVISRSDGVNGDNIYLKAYLEGTSTVYFDDTLLAFADPLSDVETVITTPGVTRYYPLSDAQIRFFAFSGKSSGDNMNLVAGLGDQYDAVLSNYGQRSTDDGVELSYEGAGTPGTANDPAKLLQFRHVMTQLTVNMVVNEEEQPGAVTSPPKNLSFTLQEVVERGTYSIKSETPAGVSGAQTATASGASQYPVVLGTNYLVPTGENLVGKKLTSLTIDDYKATAADLNDFEIIADQGTTTEGLYLLPGYAYELTFFIERLRVTAVTLRLVEWKKQDVSNEDLTYSPYVLELDLGSQYPDSGLKEVTTVILETSDRRYIGTKTDDEVRFVVLPQVGTVDSVALYTNRGLLIKFPVTDEYDGTKLSFTQLSANGMLPLNPNQPVSPTNPYLITTPVQFCNLGDDLSANAHYRQVVDVDLDQLTYLDGDPGFNGFDDFYGSYDGNEKLIAGLNIAAPALFTSNYGTIENMRLYTGGIDASSQPVAGSICANNYNLIVASINELNIYNATGIAGGICGYNATSGQILACLNTGDMLKGDVVGGLIGHNDNPSEGTIAASINIGSLNSSATSMGGLCGTSIVSSNTILRTSFWLVGTAQRYIGGPEKAVETAGVLYYDCADLDPSELRNNLAPTVGEEDLRILPRMNAELSRYGTWGSRYEIVLERGQTGLTWPTPVKK